MARQVFIFLFLAGLFYSNVSIAQPEDTLYRIDANEDKGFNFPYFLFVPGKASKKDSLYLFVQPNNTGSGNDTFSVHEAEAKKQTQQGGLGYYFASQFQIPLLVPVFPRSQSKWKYYTHMLDRDVMCLKNGPLVRIDLQLAAMMEDARKRLKEMGYKMQPKVLMAGFSSSGVFANRFALLHPELVKGYSAGGINGLLMMPFSKWNMEPLNYPLGTADYQEITGKTFDFDAFKEVHQFLYMGDADTNDAVLFDDGYSKKERDIIFKSFGEVMQPDRWFASQLQYKIATRHAQFRTYSGVGHEINPDIVRDLVKFYTEVIKN